MAANSLPLPNFTPAAAKTRVQPHEIPLRMPEIERELAAGQTIHLVREGKIIAELQRPRTELDEEQIDPTMPDFMARMKEMWGDRTFGDSTRWIREDRDSGY